MGKLIMNSKLRLLQERKDGKLLPQYYYVLTYQNEIPSRKLSDFSRKKGEIFAFQLLNCYNMKKVKGVFRCQNQELFMKQLVDSQLSIKLLNLYINILENTRNYYQSFQTTYKNQQENNGYF